MQNAMRRVVITGLGAVTPLAVGGSNQYYTFSSRNINPILRCSTDMEATDWRTLWNSEHQRQRSKVCISAIAGRWRYSSRPQCGRRMALQRMVTTWCEQHYWLSVDMVLIMQLGRPEDGTVCAIRYGFGRRSSARCELDASVWGRSSSNGMWAVSVSQQEVMLNSIAGCLYRLWYRKSGWCL